MLDPVRPAVFLFDWGDTLMLDDPAQAGPMSQWPKVHAIDGAIEVLTWAKSKGLVGIASGAADSDSAEIRAALARAGLNQFIDVVFFLRDMGAGKTDPQFWQHIIATLQIPPSQIVMTGDSYRADVAAPQAAGIYGIWFNWRKEAALSCPTIAKLEQLPRLIDGNLVES